MTWQHITFVRDGELLSLEDVFGRPPETWSSYFFPPNSVCAADVPPVHAYQMPVWCQVGLRARQPSSLTCVGVMHTRCWKPEEQHGPCQTLLSFGCKTLTLVDTGRRWESTQLVFFKLPGPLGLFLLDSANQIPLLDRLIRLFLSLITYIWFASFVFIILHF